MTLRRAVLVLALTLAGCAGQRDCPSGACLSNALGRGDGKEVQAARHDLQPVNAGLVPAHSNTGHRDLH